MHMFPREAYLHSDPSCVYDVISWDAKTKKYRLRNDNGKFVDCDHTQFTLISDSHEPLMAPTAEGNIITVSDLHEEGRSFEFITSGAALGGPSSHAPGHAAQRPGSGRSGQRRPSGGPRTPGAKAGSPEAEAAKAKVKELLDPCKNREELAEVAGPILGETASDLVQKYAHLDNGRFRMTIGNRLRAKIAKDGK